MKPIYTPALSAATVAENYKSAPYNLRTMRARRIIEKSMGCGYVSHIAQLLAEQDGIPLPHPDGTPYSYLAYSANESHRAFLRRRHQRHMLRAGWSRPTGTEPIGAKFIAWINGKEIPGSIRPTPEGTRAFLPSRNRTHAYSLNQDIYFKPIIKKLMIPTIATHGEGNLFREEELPFNLTADPIPAPAIPAPPENLPTQAELFTLEAA